MQANTCLKAGCCSFNKALSIHIKFAYRIDRKLGANLPEGRVCLIEVKKSLYAAPKHMAYHLNRCTCFCIKKLLEEVSVSIF